MSGRCVVSDKDRADIRQIHKEAIYARHGPFVIALDPEWGLSVKSPASKVLKNESFTDIYIPRSFKERVYDIVARLSIPKRPKIHYFGPKEA